MARHFLIFIPNGQKPQTAIDHLNGLLMMAWYLNDEAMVLRCDLPLNKLTLYVATSLSLTKNKGNNLQ